MSLARWTTSTHMRMRMMVSRTENRRDWKHVSGKVDHVDTHAHEDDGK
jgi:hypothetical protein